MNEHNDNYQIALIKELTNRVFSTGGFDCAIVLAKNPQLLSLFSCLVSKVILKSPYPPGTNFYYPISRDGKYRRITILSHQVESGLSSYWYKEANGTKGSECKSWKTLENFEKKAILAKDQESVDWIEQRDVSGANLSKHCGQSFPEIVSTRRDFEYWLSEDINDNNKSLLNLLGFKNFEEFNGAVNFLSPRSMKLSKEKNYIWINSIPELIDNKKHIVLLSPSSTRFEEFNFDINELYLNTETIRTWSLDELPEGLRMVAKRCSATTPISIWSTKKC